MTSIVKFAYLQGIQKINPLPSPTTVVSGSIVSENYIPLLKLKILRISYKIQANIEYYPKKTKTNEEQ